MGLVVCLVGIVSDVGPSQVLFWFCLFPSPEPFLSKSEGGGVVGMEGGWGGRVLPFWTAVQTQLAGA